MAEKENYADDFSHVLQGQKPNSRRGLPPLHPREGGSWVDLAQEGVGPVNPEEEAAGSSPNLFKLPKNKQMIVRYQQFSLSDPSDREKLEQVVNNCVSKPGWILAREEWDIDKSGNKIITIKYIEVVEKAKKKPVKDGPKEENISVGGDTSHTDDAANTDTGTTDT